MPVTLKDIAQKVGYSVTTVSRALTGYDDVAESTRELILKTANEMDYHPNITARRLRARRTDTIGIVVPTYRTRFGDPFFSDFLAGVGNKAVEYGFDLLVSTHPPGAGELKVYERMVMEQRVDGMIVISTRPQDERIIYLVEQGFLFVAFGRSDLEADFSHLDVDGEAGMRQATQHLIDLGHRRIAYISAPFDIMYAHHRLQGYKGTLSDNDIPFDETLMVVGDLAERSGYTLAHDLLTRSEPPTAIIACNDWMASGVISAIRDLGLAAGRDVSAIGFDDVPLARLTHPQLTTVRQPAYEAGWRVCEMLVRLLQEGTLEERHVLLEPQLIVRESCGAPVSQNR
jgi:LacI family transcriptional regulator